MINKYFNKYEFKQALDLMDIDPFTSKVLFEEYIQKYPKDYSAYPYYCSNLITLGELDAAEKIFNYLQTIYNEDETIQQLDKTIKIKENMFFSQLKLLSYQEKYEELYQFCKENIIEIINNGMNGIYFYSKKKTGRLNPNKRDENSYLFSQIVRYEETDFLDHIKKHLNNSNTGEVSRSVFCENFPIEKVVEEIKKYIPSNKKLLWGIYDNVYFFKYDGCGRVDNKVVDYFKVVCLHDTNEFITMCPVLGSKNLPHVDLNYLINYDEISKVKRISQIDKFNMKYRTKK